MGQITIRPEKMHTAFNPVHFRCTAGVGETKVQLTIVHLVDGVAQESAVLKRSYLSGVADFDISSIIKHWFIETRTSVQPLAYREHYLNVSYSVQIDAVALTDADYYTALNAVAQCGFPVDRTTKTMYLVRQNRLKQYPGYPLQVSFLNNTGLALYLNINKTLVPDYVASTEKHITVDVPEGTTSVSFSDIPATLMLTDYEGNILINNDGAILVAQNPDVPGSNTAEQIDAPCYGTNQFYLRWVNQLGGYEFFMFWYNQTVKAKVSSDGTYEPNVFETSSVTFLEKDLGKSVTDTITVGASNVTTDERIALSEVATSPDVQYYNKKIGKWLKVRVDDASLTYNTNDSTSTFELDITMPSRITQY